MMRMIGLFCVMFFSSVHALFDMSMYRAHKAYQAGEFAQAKKRYEQKLLRNPDDLQLNFNMGDVLYRTQQFDKAYDYFVRIARTTRADDPLKEQAYFNAGNASVKLKELQRAIEQYEKVFEINPENEHAKHNLEIVKKMLEQQQQQEQNKKEDQQQDQDKQKDQSDQEQDQQQQDQQQSGQDSSDKQQEKQGSSGGEQKEDADNKEQSGNDFDRKESEKEREGQGEDQQSEKQDQDSDGKSGSGPDEPTNTQENGQQTNDREPHTTSTTASDDTIQDESNPTSGDGKEQDKQRLETLLRILDQKDNEQNKRLMMMQVNKGMTKQDGQKNW